MDLTVGIVVIVILILLLLWFKRNRAGADDRSQPLAPGEAVADKRYHAVSISFASTACESAKALEDQRFLSNAAPKMPLPDCDVPECNCRFVHFDDRRGEETRKSAESQPPLDETGKHEMERRLQGERRGDGSKDYFW